MKRAKLIDRVRLLAEKRGELLIAARRYMDPAFQGNGSRYDHAKDLEVAAVEYAVVAIRYLGGDR